MARNCRFPDLETYGSQPRNQTLPLQQIAGSQKLEFLFFEAKQLSLQGTADSQKFETHGPKPEKSIRYQWKESVDSKKIELMVLNVVLFCLLSR